MMRILNLPMLVGFLALSCLSPGDHDSAILPDGDKIVWEKSWEDAVKRSKAENRPIMIHFNMDHEPACRNMAKDHFRNKRVLALAQKFVCVVGSLGDHRDEDVFKEDGKCGRFGTVTCAEHRHCESKARTSILETTSVTAPQFVFVTPSLDIMVRRPWDLPASELIQLMNRALFYCNPDLAPDAVNKKAEELLDKLLVEAKSDNAATRKKALDAIAKRDHPKVIKFLINQTSPDVDLVKRVEAVKAIGEAANATCLPALLSCLKDRSNSLRKSTLIALRQMGMVECINPIVKAYGVESNNTNKALGVRTVITCDSEDKAARKLLAKALKASKSEVRTHAVRACLEVDVDAKEFSRLIKLAKGDTEMKVRAVACHAATTLAVRYRDDAALSVSPEEVAAYAARRKKIMGLTKKLRSSLKSVIAQDREVKLREFAKLCLEALDSQEFIDLEEDLDALHSDDEITADKTSGKKKRRGGGGRR